MMRQKWVEGVGLNTTLLAELPSAYSRLQQKFFRPNNARYLMDTIWKIAQCSLTQSAM